MGPNATKDMCDLFWLGGGSSGLHSFHILSLFEQKCIEQCFDSNTNTVIPLCFYWSFTNLNHDTSTIQQHFDALIYWNKTSIAFLFPCGTWSCHVNIMLAWWVFMKHWSTCLYWFYPFPEICIATAKDQLNFSALGWLHLTCVSLHLF